MINAIRNIKKQKSGITMAILVLMVVVLLVLLTIVFNVSIKDANGYIDRSKNLKEQAVQKQAMEVVEQYAVQNTSMLQSGSNFSQYLNKISQEVDRYNNVEFGERQFWINGETLQIKNGPSVSLMEIPAIKEAKSIYNN